MCPNDIFLQCYSYIVCCWDYKVLAPARNSLGFSKPLHHTDSTNYGSNWMYLIWVLFHSYFNKRQCIIKCIFIKSSMIKEGNHTTLHYLREIKWTVWFIWQHSSSVSVMKLFTCQSWSHLIFCNLSKS